MANNNIPNVSAPEFDKNETIDIKETTSSGSTRSWYEGNVPVFRTGGYSEGSCLAHYKEYTLFNHLQANNMMPQQLNQTGLLIYADDIKSLKNCVNIILTKWKETNGLKTYFADGIGTKDYTYTSDNESISQSIPNISGTANQDEIIYAGLWANLRSRLELFQNLPSFSNINIQLGNDVTTDTTITKADYNKWVKAIELISKACKCNSDCACNAVCNCNSDCGCNYSDIRLKDNVSTINPRIIDSIKPIKFKYKLPANVPPERDNRPYHYGIEAQSLLESEIKESGAIKKDREEFYKVDYQELIGILIAEVQDLRKEINTLKSLKGNTNA